MMTDTPSQQIIAATAATLTATTIDQYGEPAAKTGTVTVTVTTSNGTTVTTGAVSSAADPVHTAAITAANMPTGPELLTAVWSDGSNVFATNTVEVVGAPGFYCTIAELRAAAALPQTAHSDAVLRQDRWDVETFIEGNLSRAFVPRFATDIVQSDGSDLLALRHPDLRSVVWANYWTGTAWAAISGTLSYVHESPDGWAVLRDNTWPAGPIQIGYRHGKDRPPPDLKDATIKAIARHRHGDKSAISSRVTSMTDNGMTANLATAGMRRSTGTEWITADPDIDQVLHRYRWQPPAVA